MHKYIFTDTNLFEQFVPIPDIDWLSFANCTNVTLIVPSVTLSELNEHKDLSARGRLKRKATEALSQLRGYSTQSAPVFVREGVEIQFRPKEPMINFADYQLNERVKDDRLLASAIEFAVENNLDASSVLVTTGDFGVELKAKSQRLIAPLALPDVYRLPPELDAEQKQIRELQHRLQQLQAAAPDLRLNFEGGNTFAKLHVSEPKPKDSNTIQHLLQEERSQRPFLQVRVPQAIAGWKFSLSTPEDVDEYNKSLDAYFKNLEKWLEAESSLKQWHSLTASIQFQLENCGGAPGKGIHVDIHFPDGFTVMEASDLPKLPTRPAPPLPPNERLVANLKRRLTIPSLDFGYPKLDNIPNVFSRANTKLSWIKKTNSYSVRFDVTELKHTLTELLPPLYIHFRKFDEATGFNLTYQIVASNYPEPFEGTLNVEVLKA